MGDPSREILLSFVLPAFNEERQLPAALASIREAAERARAPAWEMIVCDNNSTDATAGVASSLGAKVVYEPHNQIARARNTGAAAAQGKWLVFLDADSQLPPGLLAKTLDLLRQGSAGAGGALVSFDQAGVPWHARAGLEGWNLLSRVFSLAAGSYVFCHREAWEETGGFDQRYYAGEELTFSLRLRQWCRRRGLPFRILTSPRLITSARKIDRFTPWKLVAMVSALALPSARRRAENCAYWYDPSLREKRSEKS